MNQLSIPKRELKLDLNKEIEDQRTPDSITANNDYYDLLTQK